ncbi:MAG TPA: lipocalin family protein [Puia sp.]|nr:lipocalin family protein [Puia sp.]
MTSRKHVLFIAATALLAISFIACTKSSNNPEITVANLTGTYKLTGLVWVHANITINVYDSLDACEKDNLIQLNADSSLKFIDAGTVCTPPADGSGTWHLSKDSLYFQDQASKIKSFDGKTLVLTGYPSINGIPDITTVATTTLVKQ